MENITENNQLIAEFMGVFDKILSTGNIHSWSDAPFYYTTEDTKEKVIKNICKYSKYDLDWNWLMGVIEKIESLPTMKDNGNFFFEIHQDSVTVFNSTRMDIVIEVIGQGSRINNTYQAVIEFIKWYNNKPLVNPDEVKNNSSTKRDRVLKSIMERYGGLCNLRSAMREDEDVVLVNLCDDLNDEFSEREVLLEIIAILK